MLGFNGFSPYHFSAQNAKNIDLTEITGVKSNQMKHENGSCDRNSYDCVKKPEKKFRTST